MGRPTKFASLLSLFLFLVVQRASGGSRFYPRGDDEHKFPKYPIQEYIQVRKYITVEHLPRSYGESSNDHVQGSPSTTSGKTSGGGGASSATNEHSHYYKPPLREEIFERKKQEVYEERGYSDGHYDHSGYGEDYKDEPRGYEGSEWKGQRKPVGSEEASSTKVLEHIATNLYDGRGHKMGFYGARAHIYCPEVVDFDLSAKSQKMGEGHRPRGKAQRLGKLGEKIDCLKRKYWGEEILPSSVFMEPAQSRKSLIKMGTMDQFVKDMRQQFH